MDVCVASTPYSFQEYQDRGMSDVMTGAVGSAQFLLANQMNPVETDSFIYQSMFGPEVFKQVCKTRLFVYFHQISFTLKDNKINGYNRNKTMKKFERKNYTH